MGLWLHSSRRLVCSSRGSLGEHRALKVDQPDRVALMGIYRSKADVRMCAVPATRRCRFAFGGHVYLAGDARTVAASSVG